MTTSTLNVVAGFFGMVALVLLYVTIRRLYRGLGVTSGLAVVMALLVVQSTWGYMRLAGYPPRWLMVAAAVLLGLPLGRNAAKRAALRMEQDTKGKWRAYGRPAPGYLVVWTVGFVVALVAALAEYHGIRALGVLTMLLGAGMALSANIVLLGRLGQLRRQAAAGSLTQ